jgi:hypothetical protein
MFSIFGLTIPDSLLQKVHNGYAARVPKNSQRKKKMKMVWLHVSEDHLPKRRRRQKGNSLPCTARGFLHRRVAQSRKKMHMMMISRRKARWLLQRVMQQMSERKDMSKQFHHFPLSRRRLHRLRGATVNQLPQAVGQQVGALAEKMRMYRHCSRFQVEQCQVQITTISRCGALAKKMRRRQAPRRRHANLPLPRVHHSKEPETFRKNPTFHH